MEAASTGGRAMEVATASPGVRALEAACQDRAHAPWRPRAPVWLRPGDRDRPTSGRAPGELRHRRLRLRGPRSGGRALADHTPSPPPCPASERSLFAWQKLSFVDSGQNL